MRGFRLGVLLAASLAVGCSGGSTGPAGPTTYSIEGTVVDATGAALVGATISLSGTATATADTDASGHYRFTGLAIGSYTVTVSMAGHAFSPASDTVTFYGASGTGAMFAPFVAEGCSLDGWCWSDRPAVPGALRGVWFSGPTDGWAVGDGGSILHWDGVTWSSVASGVTGELTGIWGGGPADVWAVSASVDLLYGTQGCVHWDGTAWSTVATGQVRRPLLGVWSAGSAPVTSGSFDDVWAVGDLLHTTTDSTFNLARGEAFFSSAGGYFQLSPWSWPVTGWNAPPVGLLGVWGSAANDVWAVGYGGLILHWDGIAWSSVASGTPYALHGIWGSGASDVWAVGYGGAIVHWNGTRWSTVASGTTDALEAVSGSGPDDVWAVGASQVGKWPSFGAILHWNGVTWSKRASGTTNALHAVWSDGSGAWAVGDSGTLLHHP